MTGGSTFHVNLSPALVNSSTLTLTGSPTLTNGTTSFTVTGTANGITHINTVTLTTAPTTTENATVDTSSPGTAFPSYFVGLSLPSQTLTELTGTNSTTATSFINLLRNLSPYIGSPSIRSGLSSTTNSELAALTTGATFTVNGITTSPHFFLTVPSTYTPSTTATEVQAVMNAVGSANLLGLELDNEPDLYSGNGTRPAAWTYQDYLNETAGYQTLFAPYITAPQLVADRGFRAELGSGDSCIDDPDEWTTRGVYGPPLRTVGLFENTANNLSANGGRIHSWLLFAVCGSGADVWNSAGEAGRNKLGRMPRVMTA